MKKICRLQKIALLFSPLKSNQAGETMKRTQFDAGTFGVGELITQKKLLRVPSHQRSFAWPKEAVTTFISDIDLSFAENAADYFVGLVVIQGPEEGEWVLLDGQQRLTTSTMLFAAIRNWLAENGLADDARQIETEFLAVRRLGGDNSSRMQLNDENQTTFSSAVINQNTTKSLKALVSSLPKRSSNQFLADAALECQRWIETLADKSGKTPRDKAEKLFRLSSFLESKLKVVCVEVSTDVDAYILFESLNDRGVELSALDLVKNYAYSKSTPSTARLFDRHWTKLIEQLDDRNPDDFLKVSWTAKHGLVQKTQLFRRIRQLYHTGAGLLELIERLARDSEVLSAIDDPEDVLWNEYPQQAREHVHVLRLLGSRQVRAVALSGISNLPPSVATKLLWFLVVVVVRYQIIGKGRTGVMEKVFGDLCKSIANGKTTDADQIKCELRELWTDNAEFKVAFANHGDSRLGRYAYFLAAVEQYISRGQSVAHGRKSIQELLAASNIILFAENVRGDEGGDTNFPVGAFTLIEKELSSNHRKKDRSYLFERSEYSFTRTLNSGTSYDRGFVSAHSTALAEIAAIIWSFEYEL